MIMRIFWYILLGMFIGGAVIELKYNFKEFEEKSLEEDIYNKATLETFDKLLKSSKISKDTTKIVCMDFAYKKDTVHVPMWSKKIKTNCE